MKKLALTLAIVLGLSMTTFAEGGEHPWPKRKYQL